MLRERKGFIKISNKINNIYILCYFFYISFYNTYYPAKDSKELSIIFWFNCFKSKLHLLLFVHKYRVFSCYLAAIFTKKSPHFKNRFICSIQLQNYLQKKHKIFHYQMQIASNVYILYVPFIISLNGYLKKKRFSFKRAVLHIIQYCWSELSRIVLTMNAWVQIYFTSK